MVGLVGEGTLHSWSWLGRALSWLVLVGKGTLHSWSW